MTRAMGKVSGKLTGGGMTPEQREAVRLLGVYTAGRFDFYLWGPAKASCRAHIMSALTGRRVPQSAAGINALRDAMLALSGVTGTCPADREDNFTAWAKGVTP